MKEISAENLNENPFKLIGKDWMLITAEKENKVNMMTASWGGVGVIWGKNAATIYIRQSRFTKPFIDEGETFSLCVLPENMRDVLNFCGSKSGRDFDKVSETGLSVEHVDSVPYFKESRLVLVCKKLFQQRLDMENAVDKSLTEKFYGSGDFHDMYIAEITKVLIEE
ncbi:MAG: flavin reductase family protein [Treponema sp.]|nr:flavin reductase family protein [Treponema sp.]